MRRRHLILALLFPLLVMLVLPFGAAAAAEQKKMIYDEAGLLSTEEQQELNDLANKLGAKRDTDILIITSENATNLDVIKLTEDFYDENAPGYDKPHGNAVMLVMDMRNRKVYVAGFGKAETYVDDGRADRIREKITPQLSSGDYAQAFEKYIEASYNYLGIRPGVNPDNPLFSIWVQLGGAVIIGGIVVGIMAYRSGGRITVNGRTYENSGESGILERHDQYIRTTVTKRKIEKNNGGGSGGGGGGGVSAGGHSHSGSKGSF
ncbi:TPM domain-containing protein [Gorillibacterium timonense]|uniref:TPM domain-containing protein n=1 Tax=Gorillibacterium timonense TaxID=1689269 RepID=UPI00071E2BBF|nr:TPM domain-containing protein [Gorillibacterium timonense]